MTYKWAELEDGGLKAKVQPIVTEAITRSQPRIRSLVHLVFGRKR